MNPRKIEAMVGHGKRILEGCRENGYCESFNSKMRDEFLSREIVETFYEVEVLTKEWIRYYNYERPYSSLGYKPPAIQTVAA